ncbi:MAG: molybdate ABC transporter substrate-binding protein [Gammaproteobacteria bacterium]
MFRFPACIRLFGFVLSLLPLAAAAEAPAVAAASSLQSALGEIAAQFHTDTGKAVRLSFGSSGNFYRQIAQGAPFEIFFSADEAYIDKLAQADLTMDEGTLYAAGRIVLFAPHGSALGADEQGGDLKAALDDGRVRRFAIANPEHAPYGHAAKEALQSLGLWSSIKPKLVLGENVSQAAQFAIGGSTQGGIFAYSLALAPNVAEQGVFVLLPEHLHQPLRQRVVLVRNAGETAQRFYSYVQQPPARAIFRRYGFVLPGE